MDVLFFFFFFKQKTAYEMRISDWSSDVCSSDLIGHDARVPGARCRRFASSSPEAREGRPRGSQGDDVVHQDSATTRTQGEFAWQLGADPGSIGDRKSVV